MSATDGHKIRFDADSEAFEALAAAYRESLSRAEELRARALRAEEGSHYDRAEQLRGKLRDVEGEISRANEAIDAHVRATATSVMSTRRRGYEREAS